MRRAGPTWLLFGFCAAAAVYGCRVDRDRDLGATFHPDGFADPDSGDFHGDHLREHGYPLAGCRECHGDDYEGGTVEVSCTSSGCHTAGVESCGTCHSEAPASGAHEAHREEGLSCRVCHDVPKDARSAHHPNGTIEVPFPLVIDSGGTEPSFDAATRTCSDVYCHGGREVEWRDDGEVLGCGSCHSALPETHLRFAEPSSDCWTCHGSIASHRDGHFDLEPLGCAACHGKGSLGAPPPGLLLDRDGPGVGAHSRHLDPTLPDRIGQTARCSDCHDVPEEVTSEGHLDGFAPADVSLRNGERYDAEERTCVAGCHWDAEPGPRWDDESGGARACDACHGMPPVETRIGTAHPPVSGGVGACASCHPIDPSIHVDGKVDFTW